MSNPIKDMTGLRFGRLVVIKRASGNTTSAFWLCKCDCGEEVVRRGVGLRLGQTKSCGCKRIEDLVSRNKKPRKVSDHPLRWTWKAMVDRCCNKYSNSFKNYGAKGISVCDRWKNSFWDFVYDMGDRPEGTTLDRIDWRGNYEPSNCRWATHKEQGSNRRNVRKVLVDGAYMSIPDACKRFGTNPITAHSRLKYGWDIFAAVSTPPVPARERYSYRRDK